MSKTLVAIIIGCAALIATSAQAQPGWLEFQPANQHGVRQASVKYGDLDLNRGPGRDALRQRVGYALKMVCRADGGRSLTDHEGQCRRDNAVQVEENMANIIATRRAAGQIAQVELGVRRRSPGQASAAPRPVRRAFRRAPRDP